MVSNGKFINPPSAPVVHSLRHASGSSGHFSKHIQIVSKNLCSLLQRSEVVPACYKVARRYVQKGEEKIVDFADDKPYAVEALLIYLYTLEYPIRKPHKFREPWTNGCAPAPVLPASSSTAIEVYKKPAGLCAKMGATDYARSKLKSLAPEESWQEHAGIYCIAKRLDLASLAATSLKLIIRHLDTALRTGNVKEFIRGLYNIYNDKIQGVRDEVAKNMADQEFCVISEFELYDAIICCPVFGCHLANAMRKRDKRQTEMIAELRRPSDKQKKRRRLIDDLSGDSPTSVSNP
jgi:hypothetical protein